MGIVDVLESGTLGFFWTASDEAPDLESDPERGHVRIEEGWVVLDVLDENPMDSLRSRVLNEPTDPPKALIGVMPEEAALFLEVRGPWGTQRFGAARASSKRFLARTVIGGVPVNRLRTPALHGLHAHFHGVGRWAGMSASEEKWKTDDGRMQEWSVTLAGSGVLSHRLPGGRTLVISTTWRVDGPTDRRTIYAPVSIGCESRRPVDVRDLLEPILRTQDLLGFAFEGFVAADGGSARPDLALVEDEKNNRTQSLWNGALMVRSPAAQAPRSMNEFPLFHLHTIGGIAGLARWIRLSIAHPRAIGPIVARYRQGRGSAPVIVMEVAAGIEYWARANQSTPWAASAVKKKRWVQALADRCGKAFSDWVGDPEAWAKAFWLAYDRLKHEPTYEPDPMELADLAESARYLLGAAVLDRAARNRRPSRAIFRHHRLNDLGLRLRERYA